MAFNRMEKWQRHPGQKLKDGDVLRIRHMFKNKTQSQSASAKEYGVSRQLISLIVKGKAWKHLK